MNFDQKTRFGSRKLSRRNTRININPDLGASGKREGLWSVEGGVGSDLLLSELVLSLEGGLGGGLSSHCL